LISKLHLENVLEKALENREENRKKEKTPAEPPPHRARGPENPSLGPTRAWPDGHALPPPWLAESRARPFPSLPGGTHQGGALPFPFL